LVVQGGVEAGSGKVCCSSRRPQPIAACAVLRGACSADPGRCFGQHPSWHRARISAAAGSCRQPSRPPLGGLVQPGDVAGGPLQAACGVLWARFGAIAADRACSCIRYLGLWSCWVKQRSSALGGTAGLVRCALGS